MFGLRLREKMLCCLHVAVSVATQTSFLYSIKQFFAQYFSRENLINFLFCSILGNKKRVETVGESMMYDDG